MRGEEGRAGSNMGGGQMVAADYLMRPSSSSPATPAAAAVAWRACCPGAPGAVAGSVGVNEASTTLLLVDIRSGVQISAAEGSSRNYDFGFFGSAFTGGLAGGASGYSKTPQGRVITAAFADSFNQMVKTLRNYKAQTVKGGLDRWPPRRAGRADAGRRRDSTTGGQARHPDAGRFAAGHQEEVNPAVAARAVRSAGHGPAALFLAFGLALAAPARAQMYHLYLHCQGMVAAGPGRPRRRMPP